MGITSSSIRTAVDALKCSDASQCHAGFVKQCAATEAVFASSASSTHPSLLHELEKCEFFSQTFPRLCQAPSSQLLYCALHYSLHLAKHDATRSQLALCCSDGQFFTALETLFSQWKELPPRTFYSATRLACFLSDNNPCIQKRLALKVLPSLVEFLCSEEPVRRKGKREEAMCYALTALRRCAPAYRIPCDKLQVIVNVVLGESDKDVAISAALVLLNVHQKTHGVPLEHMWTVLEPHVERVLNLSLSCQGASQVGLHSH
jgi:hypothetical protein